MTTKTSQQNSDTSTSVEEQIKQSQVTMLASWVNVWHSPTAGCKVTSTKDIKQGEIVEQFIFSQAPWRVLDLDSRTHYFHKKAFPGQCACEHCRRHGASFMIAAGNPSLYPHSSNANCTISLPEPSDAGRNEHIGVVTATQDIRKHEELFIDHAIHYSRATPYNSSLTPAGIAAAERRKEEAEKETSS